VDVGAWLRDLGLGRYEPAFRDNEIDAEILPKLTADDLKDLGVTVVGHRRKLLEAIAALPAPRDAAMPAPGPPAAPPNQAERRQLTVMFVDLVGSTGLSGHLDPEEMREVLRSYQDAVAGEVTRLAGHVAKYMGDGVLAYFGWPQAHEDAAERAVRAGLAVVQAVARLNTPTGEPLACRVGIATGLVVVGDLIGAGAAREEAVVGETPNLAARLQALAVPGAVVIAPGTHRLVGGLFELDDLGTHRLKGLVEPVRAWRAVGASAAESRFEARHVAGLTPLVGRDEELALLLRRFEQAKDDEGQVVLLSGEPGIGKSRIVRALRERLADEPHTPLRYQCSPYHTSSALYAVIDQLERAAGFQRDDPAGARLAKLEALLAEGTRDVAAVAPLVADLLSVPTGDRYPPLDLTPQRRKEKLFAALLAQLAGLAAKRPVLNVFEDVHWLDPTTEELLGLVVDRVRGLPVLLVITARPEFTPRWGHHAHVTLLTLNRLSRRQGAAMVARVSGGKPLPPAVLEQIVARTDGVPLFVEELTKAVLESGLLRETDEAYALDGPLPPLAIPSTLHDSLMARLDRLAPVKETAQVGACIGREFSYALLTGVSALPEPALLAALDGLVEAELVFARGTPPEASYAFKHVLVQEVAYQSLLKSKRQQLHAEIAQVLEERFPDLVETEPEILAYHCTAAGLTERAVGYWQRAGQRALARSAMAEAIAHLTKGLEMLERLPAGPERHGRELALQLALGSALISTKGLAAVETDRAYARAHELCLQTGATPQLLQALFGRFVVHFQRAELSSAHDVARELLSLAERRGDVAAQVAGCRAVGAASLQLGELVESRAHLERGLALYDPVRDRASGAAYGIDSRVVCLNWLSLALLSLGHPDQARARAEEAVAWARELAHPSSVAHALCGACFTYQRLGRRTEARAGAEPLIRFGREQGFPLWGSAGMVIHGWALADAGQTEEGVEEIRQGLAEYSATGAELWLPEFLALHAEAASRAGQATAGLGLVADALDRVARGGRRWIEPELYRLKGELLLALPEANTTEAEACFRHAIAIAREHSAKMLELRAATSLARLWRDNGRTRDARELLAPVYDWFSEGFDTPDLQGAKALLVGLQ
jgi:class 3 adenylate cyclase/predicted ATPase